MDGDDGDDLGAEPDAGDDDDFPEPDFRIVTDAERVMWAVRELDDGALSFLSMFNARRLMRPIPAGWLTAPEPQVLWWLARARPAPRRGEE